MAAVAHVLCSGLPDCMNKCLKTFIYRCSLFFFVFVLCFLCFFDRTNDGLAYLFMKSGNPICVPYSVSVDSLFCVSGFAFKHYEILRNTSQKLEIFLNNINSVYLQLIIV